MCAKQIMRTALWKYLHPFPVMITLITETKCSTLWLLAAATTISLKHIPSVVESDTTTLPPTPPNKNPCHKYSNQTTSIYQEHTWSTQYSMSSQINKIKQNSDSKQITHRKSVRKQTKRTNCNFILSNYLSNHVNLSRTYLVNTILHEISNK